MSFKVVGDAAALTQAIEAFSSKYHEDYFEVRAQAGAYLSKAPTLASAQRLAVPLLTALKSWGAGKRGAPSCKLAGIAAQALCEQTLHRRLQDLAKCFQYLDVVDGRRVLNDGAPYRTVVEFDKALIKGLSMLGDALLVCNTNVTYPMKALLLLTGLTPALDSQVKGGLAIAGVSGINKTRYLLPSEDCRDARKICVLPFYIANCVAGSRSILDAAVENSRYPMLKGEYGRLFDVLLFVQRGLTPQTALLRFHAPAGGLWYEI